MDTMSALIFDSPGNIHVEDLPVPETGPGDILMRVRATSICYSDIRVYKGEKKAKAGVIPGHEIAGEIASMGSEVEGFSVGERITICPILACGECYYCMTGKRNRCVSRTTLGYEENGGLAHYVLIPKQLVKLGHVIPLPENLPYDVASLTEPFACALNSLESCRVQPGSTLAIVGAGPMGLIHVLLAAAIGCPQIIVSDPVEERLAWARELGATVTVNPTKESLEQVTMKATGGLGADAVVLSVGTVGAIADGLAVVRKQGYYNLFGGFPPGASFNLDPNRIHYDEIFLTGTQNATPDQYFRSAKLLNAIPKAAKLITHRFGPKNADEAYKARLDMSALKTTVIY
ncbi:MAG: hypothetical protein HW403_368 [Dehalococcoidia bacterium]|nr:hypothetical protein [Dehalococcoidia bacterium]